jgi:hypothetical protein
LTLHLTLHAMVENEFKDTVLPDGDCLGHLVLVTCLADQLTRNVSEHQPKTAA